MVTSQFPILGTNLAQVENLSWTDCIDRYDRPHTFFYLYPPYWQTEGYGVPFEFEQYVCMAELAKTVKGKMMISLNDHPQIRECFRDLHIETVDIEYSLGSRHGSGAKRGELVITNYDPHTELGGLFKRKPRRSGVLYCLLPFAFIRRLGKGARRNGLDFLEG